MDKEKTKTISIRLPDNHPIFAEENKNQVLRDALELYYATKGIVTGQIKLKTIQFNYQEQKEYKEKKAPITNPKVIKSFINAFQNK
ncbi:hypothetical protein ACAG39_02085 [Caldicellulosiruptoraceae bacterium PP1]